MRLVLIAALLGLSACATPIHYSHKEKCAFDEMKLIGTNRLEGTASGASYAYGHQPVFTNTTIEGVDVRCAVPETPQEKAEIDKLRAAAVPKVEYNSHIGAKQFVTGVGYFFYIVPGVLAKLVFDEQYNAAVKASDAILNTPAQPMPASIPNH